MGIWKKKVKMTKKIEILRIKRTKISNKKKKEMGIIYILKDGLKKKKKIMKKYIQKNNNNNYNKILIRRGKEITDLKKMGILINIMLVNRNLRK